MKLVDTHAHLDSNRFNRDREEVMKRAWEAGLEYIINIGADIKSSQHSVQMSKKYAKIYATVGIHPHDADKLNEKTEKVLRELVQEEKVVAIGEIGLDYHYDNSPRDVQRNALRRQLTLAREVNLPVVIHNRESDQDMLKILKEEGIDEPGGIFHCFSSGLEMAREVLDMGLYLAFGGVITFKNASELRRVVEMVPLDRILLETDSPYLTPEPHRGRRNEPAYVRFVAEKIGKIKKLSLDRVAEITTENARAVYNL